MKMSPYISILILISSLSQVNGQDPEPCNFPCSWQQAGNFTSYGAQIRAGEILLLSPSESVDVIPFSFSTENPSEVNFLNVNFVCHEITDQFIVLRALANEEYIYVCIQTIEVSDDPLQFQWTLNEELYSDKCTICRDPDTVLFFRAESTGAVPVTQPYIPLTCTTPAECTECESCDLCTEAETTTLEGGCNTPYGPTYSNNCKKSRGKSHGKSRGKSHGKSRGKSYGKSRGKSYGKSRGKSYGKSRGKSYVE